MLTGIERVTSFVSTHLTKLILAVMVLGLLNAYFFGGIPFNLGICATASFLMIYPMFINLKVGDVVEMKDHKRAVALSLFLNFLVSPALAWGLGRLFLADQPYLALGLVLISLIPTSGMTATWTERSKGNLKVALGIIAVSLVVVIVSLPLVLPRLAGSLLNAGPFFIFQRILMVIVIPLVLGDVTRRILVAKKGLAYYKSKKPLFSGLSSTGLLFVLFLIMSLSANKLLLSNPALVLKAIVPLVAYYAVMFGASTLLSRGFGHGVATAIVFGTSVRYLALALGIAVPLLGTGTNSSMVVFVVALAFFVQVPASSLYSKWITRHAAAAPAPSSRTLAGAG
jgi:ACR3 family arsenite efflux pump ArsB